MILVAFKRKLRHKEFRTLKTDGEFSYVSPPTGHENRLWWSMDAHGKASFWTTKYFRVRVNFSSVQFVPEIDLYFPERKTN